METPDVAEQDIIIPIAHRRRLVAVVTGHGAVHKRKILSAVNISFRVECEVENHPDRVAGVVPAHAGNTDIESATDPPARERLPEILVDGAHPEPVSSRVPESRRHQRIGHETSENNTAIGEFPLQERTEHRHRKTDVFRKVVESLDHRARHDRTVHVTDRTKYPTQEQMFTTAQNPIKRLYRVAACGHFRKIKFGGGFFRFRHGGTARRQYKSPGSGRQQNQISPSIHHDFPGLVI